MQLLLFIIALLLFIGLVVIHEFGHYIVAKRNGVHSEEFGIGFPPRAWSKRLKSGLLLSINWLPLGGFVKLKGESDSETAKGSFGAASVKAKTKILLAGVTMNLIGAIVLLTILAVIGMPVLITKDQNGVDQFTVKSDTKITNQQVMVGDIQNNSPAYKAGLKSTDVLTSISDGKDSRITKSASDVDEATTFFAGKKVELIYKRQGSIKTAQAQLLSSAEVTASLKTTDPKGYLGVIPTDLVVQRSTWSAPVVAIGFTAQLAKLTVQGLGHAIAGLGSTIAGGISQNHVARENGQDQASSQVGGPVALMKILWSSGSLGFVFILLIIAMVSLSLAVFNVLPIPGLDGGRLVMILISRLALKRPLTKKMEEKLVGFGYLILLVLVILITIVDVKRYF